MRWIWIDRFVEFHPGKSARAIKVLSLAEDLYANHFPGYPVMPACLILEGLAQTGGVLVGEVSDFKEKVILAKVPQVNFHREVLAGECLTYDAEVLHLRPEGAAVQAKASVGEEAVVTAEIFFAFLDQSRARSAFDESNFVFTGELKYLLRQVRALAASSKNASAPA
jgi:3-hydroxyacyl-[acyl-carrier-protein] dehydratase